MHLPHLPIVRPAIAGVVVCLAVLWPSGGARPAYADPDQHKVIVGLATTSALVTTWWHPERALDLVNNIGGTAGANVYYESHIWTGSGTMTAIVEDYPGVCTGLYLHVYDAGFNSLGHLRYTHISPSRAEGTRWQVAGTGWTIQHVGTVLADENQTCKNQGLWTGVHLHQGADNSGTQIQSNGGLEAYVAGLGHPNVIEPVGDYDHQWMYTTNLIDSDGDTLSDQDEINIYHTDPHKADTDGDGCAESEDLAMGFNPLSPWDVMDVPTPANADPTPNGARNRVVDMLDVLAVLFYAYAFDNEVPNSNGVDYDSRKDGDWMGPTYMYPDSYVNALDEVGRRYDRSAGNPPTPQGFDPAGPPNTQVDIGDVLAALAQAFKVDCSGPP